jgi:hypothetical protein
MRRKVKTTVPDIGKRDLIDRKSWTVYVTPDHSVSLGRDLYPGLMVMRNRGPGTVQVFGESTEEQVLLRAGDIRIISIRDSIDLAMLDLEPARVEFDLVLAVK